MRKIFFAGLLLSLSLSACAGNTNSNNNQPKETKKMGTIHITKAEFIAKVANYEKNPTEWKYLGDIFTHRGAALVKQLPQYWKIWQKNTKVRFTFTR